MAVKGYIEPTFVLGKGPSSTGTVPFLVAGPSLMVVVMVMVVRGGGGGSHTNHFNDHNTIPRARETPSVEGEKRPLLPPKPMPPPQPWTEL